MTARTEIVLTREQGCIIEFRLDEKQLGYAPMIGLLKPGSSINAWLGRQRGSIGISSVGTFWMDSVDQKHFMLPRFDVDDIISIEWQPLMSEIGPAGKLTFRVNGALATELTEREYMGTFDGWVVAHSGTEGWTLLEVANIAAEDEEEDEEEMPHPARATTAGAWAEQAARAEQEASDQGTHAPAAEADGATPQTPDRAAMAMRQSIAQPLPAPAEAPPSPPPPPESRADAAARTRSRRVLNRLASSRSAKLLHAASGLTLSRYLRRHRTKSMPTATALPHPAPSVLMEV